jgi:hypothetical protein
MTKQSVRTTFAALAGVTALCVPFAPALAKVRAGSQIFQGLVEHVSTNNIKVVDPKTKQTVSFVLVPHFGNVFKKDGRTTMDRKYLAEGQYVKVYFDQKALGARHADRILVLSNSNMAMKSLKN